MGCPRPGVGVARWDRGRTTLYLGTRGLGGSSLRVDVGRRGLETLSRPVVKEARRGPPFDVRVGVRLVVGARQADVEELPARGRKDRVEGSVGVGIASAHVGREIPGRGRVLGGAGAIRRGRRRAVDRM